MNAGLIDPDEQERRTQELDDAAALLDTAPDVPQSGLREAVEDHRDETRHIATNPATLTDAQRLEHHRDADERLYTALAEAAPEPEGQCPIHGSRYISMEPINPAVGEGEFAVCLKCVDENPGAHLTEKGHAQLREIEARRG